MKLSVKQRGALLRLTFWNWQSPRGNGCIQYGFGRTLWSLKDRGLVDFLRPGDLWKGEEVTGNGWVLTDEGEKLAEEENRVLDTNVRREATR